MKSPCYTSRNIVKKSATSIVEGEAEVWQYKFSSLSLLLLKVCQECSRPCDINSRLERRNMQLSLPSHRSHVGSKLIFQVERVFQTLPHFYLYNIPRNEAKQGRDSNPCWTLVTIIGGIWRHMQNKGGKRGWSLLGERDTVKIPKGISRGQDAL